MDSRKQQFKLFIAWIIVTVLLLFTIVKCHAQEYDDVTVESYVDEFLQDAQKYNASMYRTARPYIILNEEQNLYVTDPDLGWIQASAVTYYQEGLIVFDTRSYIYQYNLKVLVYHELGHWYLNRPHTLDLSMMNVSIWTDVYWDSISLPNQNVYLQELFK